MDQLISNLDKPIFNDHNSTFKNKTPFMMLNELFVKQGIQLNEVSFKPIIGNLTTMNGFTCTLKFTFKEYGFSVTGSPQRNQKAAKQSAAIAVFKKFNYVLNKLQASFPLILISNGQPIEQKNHDSSTIENTGFKADENEFILKNTGIVPAKNSVFQVETNLINCELGIETSSYTKQTLFSNVNESFSNEMVNSLLNEDESIIKPCNIVPASVELTSTRSKVNSSMSNYTILRYDLDKYDFCSAQERLVENMFKDKPTMSKKPKFF